MVDLSGSDLGTLMRIEREREEEEKQQKAESEMKKQQIESAEKKRLVPVDDSQMVSYVFIHILIKNNNYFALSNCVINFAIKHLCFVF